MIDKITQSALRFPGLVLLAVLAVLAVGVYKYQHLPVDAFPDISPIMVPVFAEGHGMAPEEIERLITYPIESAMSRSVHGRAGHFGQSDVAWRDRHSHRDAG